MTWITYDVSKKLIVINFTDFRKSFCFCGTQFRTFTLQRWINASILSLYPARVKPIQALTGYVFCQNYSVEYVVYRHSRFRPCARDVFNANTDWAQLLSTLSTCSFTVRVLVTVTPRIFMLSTRLISVSSAGNWVECFRRLSTNIISSDFMRFNFRLLASDHCSMLWMELAGTTR